MEDKLPTPQAYFKSSGGNFNLEHQRQQLVSRNIEERNMRLYSFKSVTEKVGFLICVHEHLTCSWV